MDRTLARRLRGPALLGVGAAAVIALAGIVDPNEPGHYPTCPFLATTGFYCPGCGTLRAVHALVRGDLSTALARNPAAVLALVVGTILWARAIGLELRGRSSTLPWPRWIQWALPIVVAGYWVLRNVPGWTWLSPA